MGNVENVRMVKEALTEAINEVCKEKEKYSTFENAFIRNRDLPLPKLIEDILLFENKSIEKSLLGNHQFSKTTPTAAAFVRQRNKLKPEAFEHIFNSFNSKTSGFCTKKFEGYRLLAGDGTDVNIYLNPNDEETYISEYGKRGFNLLHVNTLYDLENQIYTDVTISGKRKTSERRELNAMADRAELNEPTILILDRGYEGLNVFAHLIKDGFYFLIRLKDTDSNGVSAGYKDCGEAFDVDFDKIIRRYTPYHAENRDDYKVINDNATFDFLKEAGDEFPVQFRIVRFQLDNGNYECLATNLSRGIFPPEKLKALYARRWGIELSYRDLKYTLGMNNMHSRKTNSIKQEIYSNLIMHNFSRINSAFAEVKKK